MLFITSKLIRTVFSLNSTKVMICLIQANFIEYIVIKKCSDEKWVN